MQCPGVGGESVSVAISEVRGHPMTYCKFMFFFVFFLSNKVFHIDKDRKKCNSIVED